MCRTTIAVTLALLLLGGGCGTSNEATVPVSGKVLLPDGKPVPNARVVFRAEKGVNAEGMSDESGQYSLSTFRPKDGAVAGVHQVIVLHQPPRPPHDEASGQPLPPEPPSLVSPEHASYETSGLTVTVEKGKTTGYDLNVKGRSP